MYRPGHIGVSLLFASFLVVILPVSLGLPMAAILLLTERIPDYDQDVDWLSHRGFSHTIWFATLVSAGFAVPVSTVLFVYHEYFFGEDALSIDFITNLLPAPSTAALVVGLGTFLGFVSHLSADVITVGEDEYGVQPLHPVSDWEVPIQLWRADSRFGNLYLFILGAFVTAAVVYVQWLRPVTF